MTRPLRILRNSAIGIAAFIVVVVIAVILIVQTGWFRNLVREKIVAATEEGTGGRAEIESFSFNWRALEAVITGFVIHGKEPLGAAAFVRADRLQLNLRLFTSLRRAFDAQV